jgi:hypothetical protein
MDADRSARTDGRKTQHNEKRAMNGSGADFSVAATAIMVS